MKFSSVIGHADVKRRLINMAKGNRISHAQLFLGPEGGGNLPMAIAFAQYLVCENPTDDDSCGLCPGCKKMQKLIHPDVSFSFPIATKDKLTKPKCSDFIAEFRSAIISNPYLSYESWMESLKLENKQGFISAEEGADITRRLTLTRVESRFRIVIIWLPEFMKKDAANKLLKILEEPPNDTLFFLACENYEGLLPTIISRTQMVKVGRISDEDMFETLTKIHGLDKLHAQRITHQADGCYSDALMLLSQDETDSNLNEKFLAWMRVCLRLNVSGISELSNSFGGSGREAQKNFLRHCISLARECMLINYGDRSLVRLNGKDLEDIRKFAPFLTEKNMHHFVQELTNAHSHIEGNANSKLVFSDLSFTVHRLLNAGK